MLNGTDKTFLNDLATDIEKEMKKVGKAAASATTTALSTEIEALGDDISAQFIKQEQKIDKATKKIDKANAGIKAMGKKLGEHDTRFDQVDSSLDDIKKGQEAISDTLAVDNLATAVAMIVGAILGLLVIVLYCTLKWVWPFYALIVIATAMLIGFVVRGIKPAPKKAPTKKGGTP